MSEPVARGRIKVDARKALDKLRDHMLVDAHLWACEIARVAIALGATTLDVRWTANDFTLDFDGRTLPIEQIARARDHVLTPLDGPDGDALRSLGIGIGAALGLDPVEVTSGGRRVRFESFEDDAPTPIVAESPGPSSTRVQLRHRIGLASFTRAFGNDVPAEAVMLETRVDRGRIVLKMQGSPRPKPAPPLVTVDLDVPGATRAALEIHDPNHVLDAEVRFYEHGVLLTSLAAKPLGLLNLPLRYVVDAPRLPTNASRSQMREDAELTRRVADRVLPSFRIALAALRGEKTLGHDVTIDGDASEALGAIVAAASLAVEQGPEARALLDVPVVYDAVGRLIPLRALRTPLRIYTGAEAMPAELAAWFEGVLWKRGIAAERAVAGWPSTPADDLVLPAKKALERRARAMQHAASPPVVTPSDATIHRESFTVGEGPFAGLHGEVAIVKAPPGRFARARVFVDERALEELPLAAVRLPIELALAWPGHIVAAFDYDAVERNDDLTRALYFAVRIVAAAIGADDPALARLAMTAWTNATRALNDVAAPGALSAAAIWRTNDERLVSLDAIVVYARKTGAICIAKTATQARDGRLIVASADFAVLRELLPNVKFVAYDEFLDTHHGLPEAPSNIAVLVQRGPLEGWIQPGLSRLRVYHASTLVRSESFIAQSRYGMVDVVLVDRAAVPNVYASPIPELAAEERQLFESVIAAVERGAVPLDDVDAYVSGVAKNIDDAALKERARALPAQRKRMQRERGKTQVLERAPFDLAGRIGDLPRGTAANKRGAVCVVLLGDGRPPAADLLFQGHPLGTITRWTFPLDVFVDVVDELLVDEHWWNLTEAGLTWADAALIDAALDLVGKLVARDDFAENPTALALLARLAGEASTRVEAIVQQVQWPTVQGPRMKLGDEVSARVAGHRYDAWQTASQPSPYDAPVIHLPVDRVGEARRKVLVAAGITIEDVTEQVARLQAFRGKSGHLPPPKLDGEPAHPLLRASLDSLGVTLAEGELELFDGDWSHVARVDKDGVRVTVPMAHAFPIRVVCRTEGEWFAAVDREIQRASLEHLHNLMPKADELPAFARKQLRRLILSDLAKADEDARVFVTTTGTWLSLRVVKVTSAEYTTAAPPFPPTDDVVLCLDDAESTALAKLHPLANVTEKLKRVQRGIERRNAPPREAKLDDAARAKCLFVLAIDEEGVRGELGFLHPNHANARGIELLNTFRPLAQMPDPEGWPLIGVLNDDALEPDVGFEALASVKKDQPRLHQLLRRFVGPAVSAWLTAPPSTLGVIRLPAPFLMRAIRGPKRTPAAIGVFWLPKEWPERPAIEVEGIGVSLPDRIPMLAASPDRRSRIMPVCGKVWVSAGAAELPTALEHVMEWVALRLVPYIRASGARNVARYRFDLALIGVDPVSTVITRLAEDRPDEDLLHVVARRAPELIDKAVGDAPVAAPLPMHVAVEEPVPAAPPPVQESFFAGLVRRVVEIVSPPVAPLEASPLTKAVSEALKRMSLTGEPVLYVEPARRGRPVAYDSDARAIVINLAHPLVQRHAKGPNGVLFLVVAALSEINRELVEVTDAEETAKLYDLLRANES